MSRPLRKLRPPPPAAQPRYLLRLFIAGHSYRSKQAIANLTRICEEHLPGQYELAVVDLYQQPELAGASQIVAVPTLVKQLPAPVRHILGDLADKQRVLLGLDISTSGKP
ncbi:MAG TPA: circadian clock KaiB family protein [Terriglobales bacterium]|nr:circadian clock KaiB family protein [Terriglobales bacterium]